MWSVKGLLHLLTVMVLASMSAPRSRSVLTARRWPPLAAQWRAVHPFYQKHRETTRYTDTWNSTSILTFVHKFIFCQNNVTVNNTIPPRFDGVQDGIQNQMKYKYRNGYGNRVWTMYVWYMCMIICFPLHCSGPGYWLLSWRVVPSPQSDRRKQLLSRESTHPIRNKKGHNEQY